MNNLIKKGVVVAVIILFIGVSVIPSTGTMVEKKSTMPTFYDGNTLYVGGDGTGNYTKIQDAIDNASDGDAVYVYNGTYYENIIVNKTINLNGEDKSNTTIDGGGSGDVVYVTAEWVNVNEFTIRNSGSTLFPPNYDSGVEFIYCNNCTIDSCIIINNGAGLCLHGSKNNTIIDCFVGINEFGIALSEICNVLNKILNCNIQENSKIGIVFDHVFRSHKLNSIRGNIISNNKIGIDMITSFENEITYNLICNNSNCGISIMHCIIGCDNQMIHHNNFINNSNHAFDMAQNRWFEFGFFKSKGNYWDDWIGLRFKWTRIFPFLLPYRISGRRFQFDWFPAYEPFDIPTCV